MVLPLPAPGSIGQPIQQRPPLHARSWKPLLSGLPVFGSCYGMQLGWRFLAGGYANPSGPEIAIARDIRLSDAGQTHPIYDGKPEIFDALCMHRDDVLDSGSSLSILSANAHCEVQAVASKAADILFWGVQYHPELYFSQIADYLERSDVEGFSQIKRWRGYRWPADKAQRHSCRFSRLIKKGMFRAKRTLCYQPGADRQKYS